jgi:hypothetical protein
VQIKFGCGLDLRIYGILLVTGQRNFPYGKGRYESSTEHISRMD